MGKIRGGKEILQDCPRSLQGRGDETNRQETPGSYGVPLMTNERMALETLTIAEMGTQDLDEVFDMEKSSSLFIWKMANKDGKNRLWFHFC